ncbi:MAG: glycosyltransferase family 2 protein [Bacteroidota bacterium]
MSQAKVSIAILNWNGKPWLEKFLPFVQKSSYPNHEIIVIDNASTDDSIPFLKENYPEVKLLVWDDNYGFAEGYNKLIDHVDAPYVILLNSDVEVPAGWIEPLVERMESDKELISVQPKILAHYKKTLFEYAGACGGYMDYFAYPFCRGRIFDTVEEDQGQHDSFQEVFWATGACCILRTEYVKKIGLFQGEFFAHMEEIDFCWRAKNFGYKVGCEPASKVYHVGGGALPPSSPFKTYLNVRNSLATMLLNLPAAQLLPKIFCRLCLDGIWSVKAILGGDFKGVLSVLKAHFHFYGKISFWLKRRKEIYKEKKPIQQNIGYHPKSVIWQYFVRGKKVFGDL